MNWIKSLAYGGMLAGVAAGASIASEGAKFWQVENYLRVEHDDNITQRSTDTVDSFKVIEQLDLVANFDLETTFISLRYSPSFIYWENRPSDDTDLHHTLSAYVQQEFSERWTLSLNNRLLYQDRPELIEQGTLIREENDYLYNDLGGSLLHRLSAESTLRADARYTLLRYDSDEVAEREDMDLYVAGLTATRQVSPSTFASGDFRFETIAYDDSARDSDSYYLGGALRQVFSQNLMAELRGGWQHKVFDSDSIDDENSPYADASVSFMPSPDTRLTLGGGFSQFDANVFPYANQERTRLFASASHDLTARITLSVSGSYTRSDYQADQVPDGQAPRPDGSEDIVLVSGRASYQINRSNWIDLVYQFTDVSSDLRQDYDRNRVSLGWKTRI